MPRALASLLLLLGLLILRAGALGQEKSGASGDELCLTCHAQQRSYLHTAHALTSSAPTADAMQALVQSAGAELSISGDPLPILKFIMETGAKGSTQTAVTGWHGDLLRESQRVDLVVGSGKRGQTFLSWAGNRLFELPVSYWKQGHRWINSPGYIDGTADFARPVQPGCLECHATAAVPLSGDANTNSYERGSLVLGIGCRTCHGDGAAHVAAEQAAQAGGTKPGATAILNPAHFSRDRQLDLCALCHSGIQRTALAPAFSYVPGEPLAKFFKVTATEQDRPDVHGNQVGLLERSRCFRASASMTCSTCHDVHTQGQPIAAYAARCLNCHQWQSCGESHRLGAAIKTRCVECHMPVQQTEAIVSTTAGERVQASMRTHWIKVY